MPALAAVAAVIAVCCNLTAPAGAVGRAPAAMAGAALLPVAEVDLGEFSARAQEWNAARTAYREASRELALELAADGRAAEEARLAAEEAARIAEEEARAEAARRAGEAAGAAATSTTTVPPTTAAPTTVPPPTPSPSPESPAAVPSEPADTDAPAEGAPADPAPTDPVIPETDPAAAEPVAGEPTAAQWDALRRCESGGNYAALSPGGRHRGAYQFSQATWDWVAGFADPALIGVDPAAAAPADQDALALALWRVRGWSPWPHCGAGL